MNHRKRFRLKLDSRTLVLGERTLVMGVLNVTPDSFSDGGKFFDLERAVQQALAIEQAEADLLDIGGESTRPRSTGVSAKEELARVLPVLRALRGRLKMPVSIDTQRSEVAEAALDVGAQIINDTSGLKNDRRIGEVAARRRVPLILMHMRGEPRTMQAGPFARDVMKNFRRGLRKILGVARKARAPKTPTTPPPGVALRNRFSSYQE